MIARKEEKNNQNGNTKREFDKDTTSIIKRCIGFIALNSAFMFTIRKKLQKVLEYPPK